MSLYDEIDARKIAFLNFSNEKNIVRSAWDEIHMMNAILYASRSSCLVRAVGAVLVKDNHPLARGYNGPPPKTKTCLEYGECVYRRLAYEDSLKGLGSYDDMKNKRKTDCIAVHAEVNVLHHKEAKGATLYVTNFPDISCLREDVLPSGISRIKVWKGYSYTPLALGIDERKEGEALLEKAGIELSFVSLSEERILEIVGLMLATGVRTGYQFVP